MLLHPSSLLAAQKEIDRVIGADRLPTLSDRSKLPYIDALVKEVLRWHPIVNVNLPHVVMEDDTYDGYLIPKGSIILANIFAFTHSLSTYSSPMLFNPSRFLGPAPEKDPRGVVFGFGRRICVGKELADTSIWVAIAVCCAVFNIKKQGIGKAKYEFAGGLVR